MEGLCSYRFRKKVNVRNFYVIGGGYFHQYNETVQEFHLRLSDSKPKNYAMTTARLYTSLDRMFDKK